MPLRAGLFASVAASALRSIATDSFFSDVVLLIDTDTSLNDVSPSGKTVTANGGAAITTTQPSPQGGTSSLELDGVGEYLTLVDSDDWEEDEDFTFEVRFRPSTIAGNQIIAGQYSTGATTRNWLLQRFGDDFRVLVGNTAGSNTEDNFPFFINQVVADTDYEVAVQYDATANQLDFFVNGAFQSSSPWSGNNNMTSGFGIGADALGGGAFEGFIYEIRLTKGAKRYTTAGYTPSPDKFPTA